MTVAKILAEKGQTIVTVTPGDTAEKLARVLRDNRIGAAVVSDDGRTAAGVVSERDIAFALAEHGGNIHELPVSSLMTKSVISCSPETRVSHAATLMLERNIRHLPVEQDGQLVGIVSIRDVLRHQLEELTRKNTVLLDIATRKPTTPTD